MIPLDKERDKIIFLAGSEILKKHFFKQITKYFKSDRMKVGRQSSTLVVQKTVQRKKIQGMNIYLFLKLFLKYLVHMK